MHLNAETAVQTCTQISDFNIAIMALRLTFGGAPNPSEWGAVSESCIDLTNAIMHEPDWNSNELMSPSEHLVPPYQTLRDEMSFRVGKDLFVDVPVNDKGMA